MIYVTFLETTKNNKDLKIEDAYAKYSGKAISPEKNCLSINVASIVPEAKINGKDYKNVNVLLPIIKYMFREN